MNAGKKQGDKEKRDNSIPILGFYSGVIGERESIMRMCKETISCDVKLNRCQLVSEVCSLRYTVNFWGSHPDKDNDDCFWGEDFSSLKEALDLYWKGYPENKSWKDIAYIQIDGLSDSDLKRFRLGSGVRKNQSFVQTADEGDWRKEIAHHAGMVFGTAGFNDAMGF